MRIGARIHDFGRTDLTHLRKFLEIRGIDCIQLAPGKFIGGADFDREPFSRARADRLAAELGGGGIRVPVLSCYINPIGENRRAEIERFKVHLDYCAAIGAGMVGTETGTLVSDLSDCRKNRSEEAFSLLVGTMSELSEYAQNCGARIGIEPVSFFPVYDAATVLRLIESLPFDNADVIFDPVNLLTAQDVPRSEEIFEDFVSRLAGRIRVCHMKDFRIEHGQPVHLPLFEGTFETERFLKLLKKYGVACDFILENTSPAVYDGIRERLGRMCKEIFGGREHGHSTAREQAGFQVL